MNPIKRLYNLEDEAMLVKGEVWHAALAEDLPLFQARFPFVNDAFADAFLASIDFANAIKLDQEVVADITVLTSDVNNKVLEGHAALTTLGTYASLAFMDDDKREMVFGQRNWSEAKADQEKMMNALEMAHRKANEVSYKTALLAKGYTQLEIDNLLVLAEDIRNKNILQEGALSERTVSTQDRIIAYNIVWQQMRTLNICSKVVFADNPAKIQQYLLYPYSASATKITITVSDKLTLEPISNVEVTLGGIALASKTTDDLGQVSFESVNMPDLIDINLKKGDAVAVYTNQSVMPGGENGFEVTLPK